MKKNLLILLVLLSVSGCISTKITNLTDAKNNVVDYYETEKYYNDLNSVLEEINSYFKSFDVKPNDAVVFDVDETTLSNYDYIKSIDFGYEHKLWSDWQDKGIAKAILPVKNLYNILIQKDIKVIFITGRSTKNYEATYKNLIDEGYTKFDTLICRKPLDSYKSMADFKYAMRKQMTAKGYNIIANIGDQETDFSGGYNGKIVKLPNYIYKID